MRRKRDFLPSESTLGELREIIAATADMPERAEVRVMTRWGSNGNGAKLRRVVVIGDHEASGPRW